MFAAICRSFDVLPNEAFRNPERTLPSVERGELLCEAYEWFRFDVPETRLTLEHGLLLLNELMRAELVRLGTCKTCRGVILLDRLSKGRLQCMFCSTAGGDDRRLSVLHTHTKLLGDLGEPLINGPERQPSQHCRGEQMHVDPSQPTPHQLSCFDEVEDFVVTDRWNVRQLGQRIQDGCPSRQIAAGEFPDNERVDPNLSLF